MSDFDKALKLARLYVRELESESDFHGAGVVEALIARMEEDLTEEADLECECEDGMNPLCPFHGAPM